MIAIATGHRPLAIQNTRLYSPGPTRSLRAEGQPGRGTGVLRGKDFIRVPVFASPRISARPMLTLRTILHPTDLTPRADRALLVAAYLASQTGAELHVINVIESEHDEGPVEGILWTPEEITARLFEVPVRAAGPHPAEELGAVRIVQRQLRRRSAGRAILEEAGRIGADLLVTAVHGAGGIGTHRIGSTTEKLLRRAPCPMLCVPGGVDDPIRLPFESVLTAVDLDDEARTTISRGADLVAHGARLDVLHVIEPLPGDGQPGRRSLLEAEAELERLVDEVDGVQHVVTTVTTGEVAEEILNEAREGEADLVVLASRTRSDLEWTVQGSVAGDVLRMAACPVWVVRAHPGPSEPGPPDALPGSASGIGA